MRLKLTRKKIPVLAKNSNLDLSLSTLAVEAGEICGMRKSLNKLATWMETELYDPPTTPNTGPSPFVCWLAGLRSLGVDPSRHWNDVAPKAAELLGWSMAFNDARMNSSDRFNAYVSREQVSTTLTPSRMPGNNLPSRLMVSTAKSIASSRWMPRL